MIIRPYEFQFFFAPFAVNCPCLQSEGGFKTRPYEFLFAPFAFLTPRSP